MAVTIANNRKTTTGDTTGRNTTGGNTAPPPVKMLSWLALAFMTVAVVASLQDAPATAGFGLGSILLSIAALRLMRIHPSAQRACAFTTVLEDQLRIDEFWRWKVTV